MSHGINGGGLQHGGLILVHREGLGSGSRPPPTEPQQLLEAESMEQRGIVGGKANQNHSSS
jgi:hypothetical protein